MDAWNLRNIGQQFNESKFIGIILYHNVVLVGMILVVDELTMLNPNVRFVITNILVTLLVFVIAFILLLPKFINIAKVCTLQFPLHSIHIYNSIFLPCRS